jgi:hypothetical protein
VWASAGGDTSIFDVAVADQSLVLVLGAEARAHPTRPRAVRRRRVVDAGHVGRSTWRGGRDACAAISIAGCLG